MASFPKSGTTWMQTIVVQLLLLQSLEEEEEEDTTDFAHISELAPFYEIDPHWEDNNDSAEFSKKFDWSRLDGDGRRRIFNTHLRPDMLPQQKNHNANQKVIYLTRNPLDVLTSFFHHLSNQHPQDGGYTGTLENFCKEFCQGSLAYGKWSHHLAAWMEDITNPNQTSILWIRYEDLKEDRRTQIQRIASFLEVQHYLTETTLSRVLERTSFEYMRNHQERFHPISVRWKKGYHFIRKGAVGDHQSLLTESQIQNIQATISNDWKELYGVEEAKDLPVWCHEFLGDSSS